MKSLCGLLAISTIGWHVKSAHGLIHVDDLRGLDVIGLMESDDGFAEAE